MRIKFAGGFRQFFNRFSLFSRKIAFHSNFYILMFFLLSAMFFETSSFSSLFPDSTLFFLDENFSIVRFIVTQKKASRINQTVCAAALFENNI